MISRRTYSVPGANSLWHIDGNHSLICWHFIIHKGIDGHLRMVVYLLCATNKSEAVYDKFRKPQRNLQSLVVLGQTKTENMSLHDCMLWSWKGKLYC